ncbi:MAG: bifunctional ornithine acetyltransferase/N-acetylglutamate synthase [unclassified Hahellaceae]|nr:bifunctional ornithine acetyltransferase/N-acetylglutamate synthase [Hahellaceae bacterium]|tara:strand:+ start:34935 stop:36170 length:1236 start_codon:yes stop_codon:yes gene_type:complete
MAIGPDVLSELAPIEGVRIGAANAQIKRPEGDDLIVFELSSDCQVAGVFTRNQFCAAPVVVAREHLRNGMKQGHVRYLIINTGNANAGTGPDGLAAAYQMCETLSDQRELVMPFSTGVIGERLAIEKIMDAAPEALASMAPDNWARAARGILTTDTRPKGSSRQVQLGDDLITITGISKGSGMICPNMATMLAFVACDARVSADALQLLLTETSAKTFNRITVDGDTSTNDACVLVATGAKGQVTLDTEHADWALFAEAVEGVFTELAQAIVLDGEGATKFITVQVEEAATPAEALDVAYTIAHSPLVKTAFFASDPNWGRILAAVGRARFDVSHGNGSLDLRAVHIDLNDVCIVSNGGRNAEYTEAAGQAVMAEEFITIRVRLGRGGCSDRVWTTDLSYDYVKINAEYRS